jgi:hypothetical protein
MKEGKKMVFDLDAGQVEKLEDWKRKIKDLYGEYGHYSYTFSPTGIGNGIVVKSHLANLELDLTDVDTW